MSANCSVTNEFFSLTYLYGKGPDGWGGGGLIQRPCVEFDVSFKVKLQKFNLKILRCDNWYENAGVFSPESRQNHSFNLEIVYYDTLSLEVRIKTVD